MGGSWPACSYQDWRATCDTLHAHTQVLGKLAARLAPPQPAPDGSGAVAVALDLRVHEAVVEHSGGWAERIPLTPDRAVSEVTKDVLTAVRAVAGEVRIDPAPQEVSWSVPLDTDTEHASYDPAQVSDYFAAA